MILKVYKNNYSLYLSYQTMVNTTINSFKTEFTMVILIHYKPRIAVAILDWRWLEVGGKWEKGLNPSSPHDALKHHSTSL